MIAKLIISFCAIVCVSGYVKSGGPCNSQGDCEPSHCCARRAFTDENYCVSRRKINDVCLADEVLIDGIYDISCPCEGTLKCTKQLRTTSNGFLKSTGLPRCRDPVFLGTESQAYSYGYGGSQASSGGSDYSRSQASSGGSGYGGSQASSGSSDYSRSQASSGGSGYSGGYQGPSSNYLYA